MWYAQGPGPWGPVKDFKLSRRSVSFWGMQYVWIWNQWMNTLLYLVSSMSPSSNVNPTFSINVVKISKDSWFYFTKQVSFWVRDCSLWANGAKVREFQGAFAVGTFSFHAPDLCGPWWPADGSHHHPSRHQSLDRPCKTMAKIPKIIILGYGKGDSCQISPIKNVNNLLSAAPSIYWEEPAKCLLG